MIDHPVLAALAFISALPIGWPVIRAFLYSAEDDLEDALRRPLLSFLGWFPEWTIYKFAWLVVLLAALSVAFYKFYSMIGEALGFL